MKYAWNNIIVSEIIEKGMLMKIDLRYLPSPVDVIKYDTSQLRDSFMIQKLFEADKYCFTLMNAERMLIGGIMPVNKPINIDDTSELACDYLLQNREAGIINVGGRGKITIDGVGYELSNRDGIYAGMGSGEIYFESEISGNPAKFYMCSVPADRKYPVRAINFDDLSPIALGLPENCSRRINYQYITPTEVDACRISMGLTIMESGSCWSNLPPSINNTRSESFMYFNMKPGNAVLQLMGEPSETRHLIVHNEQAVFSPGWSVQSSAGTSGYSCIWCSAGENREIDVSVRSDILELM